MERGAIAESVKTGPAPYDDPPEVDYLAYASLEGGEKDRIILLDAKEVSRYAYGYGIIRSGISEEREKTGARNAWLLRSPCNDNTSIAVGYVRDIGGFDKASVDSTLYYGVSPALNVNLSSVIFSSLITSSPDKEYKLTVRDQYLKIAVQDGSRVTKVGNVITVPYSITNDTMNRVTATRVSVLVTDKEILTNGDFDAEKAKRASVLQYEELSLSGEVGTSGTGTFTLDEEKVPGFPGTDYHVYMLAEEVHGDKETDYASIPVDITTKSMISATVTFEVKNGSWDKEPSTETTFRENTTTIYTYRYLEKDKISAVVTFKVANGS